MPAYFSIVYTFERSRVKKNFVRDLYEFIFLNGFSFRSGYYSDVETPIDEIVNWNQSLLEKDFTLGMSQHYKEDYKQILFQTDIYKELRGILFNWKHEVGFQLIVPEYDVINKKNEFFSDKVEPFKKLSLMLWRKGLVDAVQTHTENGGPYSLGSLKKGPPIADIQFAIANKSIIDLFIPEFFHNKKLTDLENEGILIENLDPWGFFKYWRNLGKSFESNIKYD